MTRRRPLATGGPGQVFLRQSAICGSAI